MSLLVEGLTVLYGHAPAVTEISLEAQAGQIVALLGRNGAGKSTTLQAIAGYVRRHEGTVALDGEELPNGDPLRCMQSGVAYLPETRRLFADLTVQENLSVSARPGRYTPRLFEERFEPIGRLSGRMAKNLSGGEQQTVAVARIFCANTPVVLLDELTEGLSVSMRKTVVELVREFAAEGGIVVLVDQNLGVVRELADCGYLLESGEVTRSGAWATLEPGLEAALGVAEGNRQLRPGATDSPRR